MLKTTQHLQVFNFITTIVYKYVKTLGELKKYYETFVK